MDVKRCRKCGETKPVEMFSGNGREKDGLHKRSRTCLGAIYEAQRQKARTNWHFAKNAISTYEKREAYIGLSSDTDQETQQATDEIQHEVVLPNIELLRLPTRTALLYAHR